MSEITTTPQEELTISLVTPEFDRIDCHNPAMPENNSKWFDSLKTKTHKELMMLGMLLWEPGHYLYPRLWWDSIPHGYLVTDISGETEPFDPNTHNEDTRFGALAYGFRTANWVPDIDDHVTIVPRGNS